MLRLPIHQVQPGMFLARPVYVPTEQERILLQRGYAWKSDYAPRLERMGIQDVWIEWPGLEPVAAAVDEEVAACQRELYWVVRRTVSAANTMTIDAANYDAAIANLFDLLVRRKQNRTFFEKLDSFDNYLFSHSVNVCYLALLLGIKLERYLMQERAQQKASWAKDVSDMALGCLLHDVGKLKLPPYILEKPAKLSAEEKAIIERHTTLGFEMVKGRIPASAAQVVLNHHQRFDGKGYPERVDSKTGSKMPPLAGKQIPVFSRIASLCDVYDAATTARCYSGAKPSVQALWEIREKFAGAFDPVVEAAFYEVVPAFPLGTSVTLSDGSEAAVVEFDPLAPTQPVVRLIKSPDGAKTGRPDLEEVDLTEPDAPSIVAAGGVNIARYLSAFPRPRYSLVGTLLS